MVWCPVREAKWNRRNKQLCQPVWWVMLWKNRSIQAICLHQPQAWRAALTLLSQHVGIFFFFHSFLTHLSWLSSFFSLFNFLWFSSLPFLTSFSNFSLLSFFLSFFLSAFLSAFLYFFLTSSWLYVENDDFQSFSFSCFLSLTHSFSFHNSQLSPLFILTPRF